MKSLTNFLIQIVRLGGPAVVVVLSWCLLGAYGTPQQSTLASAFAIGGGVIGIFLTMLLGVRSGYNQLIDIKSLDAEMMRRLTESLPLYRRNISRAINSCIAALLGNLLAVLLTSYLNDEQDAYVITASAGLFAFAVFNSFQLGPWQAALQQTKENILQKEKDRERAKADLEKLGASIEPDHTLDIPLESQSVRDTGKP